jgi:hypothetical protein
MQLVYFTATLRLVDEAEVWARGGGGGGGGE